MPITRNASISGPIIVHVWEAAWLDRSPGHAAIQLGKKYVSFWPGAEDGLLAWKGFATHSYKEDIDAYAQKKQNHWAAIIPDDDAGKPGLNKGAMLSRWEKIQSSTPDYTTKIQCSGVVNQLLLAGGSQNFAKTSLSSWSSWYLYAVSPDDVRSYCELLIQRIARTRR